MDNAEKGAYEGVPLSAEAIARATALCNGLDALYAKARGEWPDIWAANDRSRRMLKAPGDWFLIGVEWTATQVDKPARAPHAISHSGWLQTVPAAGPATLQWDEPDAAWPPLTWVPHLSFQQRVAPWLLACFGEAIARDPIERNHRFLEEALELAQACDCTASEAHQLVDYVFGRPVGDPAQEVGGVLVTLAALGLARGIDIHAAGETELARIWTKVEKIRAKQAAKPKHSPLPEVATVSQCIAQLDVWNGRLEAAIDRQAHETLGQHPNDEPDDGARDPMEQLP